MISSGLVSAVAAYIGNPSPQINELALTVLSNLAVDVVAARE